MRFSLCLALGFGAFCFMFNSDPAVAGSKAGPGLVGFTNATFTGDAGYLNYNRACAAEFSRARMCDTEEIVKTVNPPTFFSPPGGDLAWVRPSLADSDAVLADSKADCNNWKSLAGDGLAVQNGSISQGYGHISPVRCDVARPVSCCTTGKK